MEAQGVPGLEDLFDLLMGKVDPNKQYFTEEMMKKEMGQLLMAILIEKGVFTPQEYEDYKTRYMAVRNESIIKELTEHFAKRKEE